MSKYLIGVDIGGTTAKIGVFDIEQFPEFTIRRAIPTVTENGGAQILPDIAQAITSFEKLGVAKDDIIGIGVGVPGPVIAGDQPGKTLVNGCVNLGWGIKDVKEELTALTGIDTIEVLNDANAAALGEIVCGSVQQRAQSVGSYRKFTAVLVTLGTGIGGGIVRDGHIIRGASGCGGEIGHIKMAPRHPLLAEVIAAGADIKDLADFEYYGSATGVKRMAKAAAEVLPDDSMLKKMELPGAKEIFNAFKEGDELAGRVVDFYYDAVGLGLAAVASVIDPDVFIIGGGVSHEGPALIEGIRQAYRKYAFPPSRDTDFILAELGNDAGMIGTAAQLLEETE